ncbi:hypothetical protein CHS0354_008414 [Potamilus streckersoni]|uniref:Homeobox domain-containing protein n=1 Tax=Potamilus streckersoni TaxID=2493646 RepID=A0AAE0VGQ6_9BIVA|nr:hypothetical protein CHS0354_008414 [Potamilus streckersoni]
MVTTATGSQQQLQDLVSVGGTPITLVSVPIQKADASIEEGRKSIYRHPLFPLMELLFKKCEQATYTPDCSNADSFDVDIQTFVQQQEQEHMPFFSEDKELDALMVKAIQVLRIHLLELEKVNELCKDFCTRYINCLKSKLQSENLLRTESDFDQSMFDQPPSSQDQGQQVTVPSSAGNGVIMQPGYNQPTVSMATVSQGQIISGGTIYQMVQTPQGLVAQPIQIQTAPMPTHIPSSPMIHGSTPLSQIGVPASASSTLNNNAMVTSLGALASAQNFDSEDDDSSEKKKNKRGVLPKQATQIMKSWLFQHIVHPYPTEDEKRQIAAQTNLTLLQVNNWFINARRRILQPMLDASNPDQAKAKKAKPTRQPQRFWPFNHQNPISQSSTSSIDSKENMSASTPGQTIILTPGTYVTSDGQIVSGPTLTFDTLQGTQQFHKSSELSPSSESDSEADSKKELSLES